MSKIRKPANGHGKGGGGGKVTHAMRQKKPRNLRKIVPAKQSGHGGADLGAWITDNPLNLTIYTFIFLALMYAIKLIIH